MGKGENVTLPKTNFNFSVTVILSSPSAFDLDQSKNLLSGKELTTYIQVHKLLIQCALRKVECNQSHFVSESYTSYFDFFHFIDHSFPQVMLLLTRDGNQYRF